MKLNIEITEEEIKSAIERKIRVAIADESNSWNADRFIKEQVKKHWSSVVEMVVIECLQDTPRIREKIQSAIESKLKGQLNAMLKIKVEP